MRRSAIIVLALTLGLALLLSAPATSLPARPPDRDCLDCHASAEAVGEEFVVDATLFSGGPHEGEAACVDCHADILEAEDIYDHGPLGPATCDACHGGVASGISQGSHGRSRRGDGRELPTCATCHGGGAAGGGHGLRGVSDPASPASRYRQQETCGECHSGPAVDEFLSSVHGRLLLAGEPYGPTCSTCHGAHNIPYADILRTPHFKVEMVGVCGGCHGEALADYRESVHGEALLESGAFESASCVDCHGSHRILPPGDPSSTVYPTGIASDCASCHADERLIRRFNFPSEVVRVYEVSYHGRAVGFGDTQVATCSSCHAYHSIFPAADPRSSIHPDNLQRTCGGCHPGASANFIAGRIHAHRESKENFWSQLVADFYVWLIVILIGGMAVHNGLDLVRKMIVRAQRQKSEPHVVRMTLRERLLRAALTVSFLMLAYTGFALLFPDAWWVAPLNMVSDSEQFRATTHRVCGVVLTALALHQLWFLFFHPRGREQRRRFAPRLRDLRDLKDNILFYLGRRAGRPSFGRFSYIEKIDHWAVVLGTLVMVVTGFVLWFEGVAMLFMPRWLWEVFAVVHLYEAILALLAVVVWHFYYVFINPDVAPMALTWVTGRITHKELARLHPEEFEEVLEREREEKPGTIDA